LLTFTPPRGENTAVFINCTAVTARYHLNETAAEVTKFYEGFTKSIENQIRETG